MRRNISVAVALIAILVSAGCSKGYQIATDSNVPEELTAALKGKTFHEGRNLLVDVDRGQLYAVIKDGRIASLTLEVKGEDPDSVDFTARMPDPTPDPPIETPQGCDQRYHLCLDRCGRDHCCRLQCYVDWISCTYNLPDGVRSGGLTIM
jgi:hypothetical protein